MSLNDTIVRLDNVRHSIIEALNNKGVETSITTGFEDFPNKIDEIKSSTQDENIIVQDDQIIVKDEHIISHSSGWEYEILSNGTIQLTQYIGTDTEIVVPNRYIDNGVCYKVSKVGNPNTTLKPMDKYDAYNSNESYNIFSKSQLDKNNLDSKTTSITSVEVAEGVCIGHCAFRYCSNLDSLKLHKNIKYIGITAFGNCGSLTGHLILPEGLEYIDSAAFNGTNFNEVTLPKSLKGYAPFPFGTTAGSSPTCKILTVHIKSENLENSYIFPGKSTLVPLFNPQLSTIEIGQGTKIIPYCAFCNSTNLKSDIIQDLSNLEHISCYAFYQCTGLTDITIPDGVTSIDDMAFYGCTGLTGITIPDSVTSIGHKVFRHTGYYNDNNNWENNVLYIDNHLVDAKTISGSYTVNDETATIAHGIFSNCPGITELKVSDGNSRYHSANNCIIDTKNKALIAGCKNSIIPDDGSVTSIGRFSFYGCSGLTNITLPNSISIIDDYAFEGCTGLKNIALPDSVTNIGINSFAYCTGITSVTIPDCVTCISYGAFKGCTGLKSITIPHTVRDIDYYAFEGCTNLKDVYYHGTEEDKAKIIIDAYNTNLLNATWHYVQPVEESNYTYIAINNEAIITNVDSEIEENVIIPSKLGGYTVTGINSYSFKDCINVTSIVIPDTITHIGVKAFAGCSKLTNITIPDSVKALGYTYFENYA